MKIYNYHPQTHEFVNIGFADPDPLEPGKYLIPAFATNIMPPPDLDGKVKFFNEESNKWEYERIPETIDAEVEDTYDVKRLKEYPSINQQLDILYHNGYEGWKQVITEIKTKYPKINKY